MTDQPKWTPGPWMVGGVRCKIERQDSHSILRYDADKKRDETIANVWYDPKTDLGRSDAHLISAAPDLYAALEKALNFITNTESEMGETLPCGDAARAALAKARGQA